MLAPALDGFPYALKVQSTHAGDHVKDCPKVYKVSFIYYACAPQPSSNFTASQPIPALGYRRDAESSRDRDSPPTSHAT